MRIASPGKKACNGPHQAAALSHLRDGGRLLRYRLDHAGITRFQLPAKSAEATNASCSAACRTPSRARRRRTWRARLAPRERYFAGERDGFCRPQARPWRPRRTFVERIYAAARRVEWGHTTTYGALAKELGAGPEAARDVGQAMAQNPVPLIIPCHRVLAAGGKLGGFSAPGGVTAKRHMLKLEGVDLEPAPPAQRSFGF